MFGAQKRPAALFAVSAGSSSTVAKLKLSFRLIKGKGNTPGIESQFSLLMAETEKNEGGRPGTYREN